MGFGKIIKTGLALYGVKELLKDKKNKQSGYDPAAWRREMDRENKRQDDYEYDRYCFGEDDSF